MPNHFPNMHAEACDRLKSLVASAPLTAGEDGFMRLETPISMARPLDWLAGVGGGTRYYWADRDNAFEVAGIGEAAVIVPANSEDPVFDRIRRGLPDHPRARYYGGFRFRPGAAGEGRWKAFTDYRFVLPRLECCRFGGETCLAANVRRGATGATDREAALAQINRLMQAGAAPTPEMPEVLTRQDCPEYAEWTAMIGRALSAFAAGALAKVVLARETTFTAAGPFDAVAVLRQLSQNTENSFRFCFHPAADRAFLGASPERLYRRVGGMLDSEAIAGTRPRAADTAADAALGRALLDSDKDRREQAMVVAALREHFVGLCEETRVDPEPGLLALTHCRHLISRISGRLWDGVTDETILSTLHPTPAVGGSPTEAALRWIDAEEPFDRGIYAGPVGWVATDAAEFCVALRSGLVQGNLLSVYNGAGILPGSDPDEEWAEIETKMMSFLRVVGLDPQPARA